MWSALLLMAVMGSPTHATGVFPTKEPEVNPAPTGNRSSHQDAKRAQQLSEADQLARIDMCCYQQADFAFSATVLEKALRIYRQTLGEESRPCSQVLNTLGCLYVFMNEHDRPEQSFQEAVRIAERVVGKEHRTYLPAWGPVDGRIRRAGGSLSLADNHDRGLSSGQSGHYRGSRLECSAGAGYNQDA